MLTKNEIAKQSEGAMSQWGAQWKEHAKIAGEMLKERPERLKDLLYYGIGKTLVCAITGASFEGSIEHLKKYREKVDIITNDKSMSALIDNGIIPDFVVIADANVSYEEYCKPYLKHTKDIKLISNVCANMKWCTNWKGKVYFHLNKDAIGTEKVFGDISGCQEVLPAGSNVGNTLVVVACEILGYDKALLTGFDFSWRSDNNYYAFNDPDKRYYMKHIDCIDAYGNIAYTSMNLMFSFRWLVDYINLNPKNRRTKIYNCSGQGLLSCNNRKLETMLSMKTTRQLNKDDVNNIITAHKTVTICKQQEELKETVENVNVVECAVISVPDNILERLKA